MNNEVAGGRADQFTAAYDALRADPSIQFVFTRPPPEPKPPSWLMAILEWLGRLLEPVGRFLRWLGSFLPDAPFARIFMVAVLAIGACAFLWAVYQRVKTGEWRLPSFRRAPLLESVLDEEWAPEDSPVREWLREADVLAEQGRYAEAIHHLLFRSIEDISRKQPDVIRPALTSREIGATAALPTRARVLFVGIVKLVEQSLFGGRAVSRDDWTEARLAYADFALPQAWHA